MTKKEELTLLLNLFIKDNLKHGFADATIDAYVDKFINATTKPNIKKLNKLIDNFEMAVAELSPETHDPEFDADYRPYRVEQFLFNHDELKKLIAERKIWLAKKRAGVRNYMHK